MNHFLLLLTDHWLLATGTLETPSHFTFDKNEKYRYKEKDIHREQQKQIRQCSFCIYAYITSLKRELRECVPIDGTLIGRKPLSGRKYFFVIKVIDDCLSVALRRYEKILDTIEVGTCPRLGCGIIQPRR